MSNLIDFLTDKQVKIQYKNGEIGQADESVFIHDTQIVNQISSQLRNCKFLAVYEYYDGIYLTIDGKEYVLLHKETGMLLVWFQNFLGKYLLQIENLEEFAYQSRFYSETDYKEFQVSPPRLQKFTFSNSSSISCQFIENATHLTFELFNPVEFTKFPPNLQVFKIEQYEPDEHLDQLVNTLTSLPMVLEICIDELEIHFVRKDPSELFSQC